MKTKLTLLLGLVATALCPSAFSQGTSFTYQGRLNTSNAPYTGSAEFQFTLWDAGTGGIAVATNNPASVIANVTAGLFTVTLDFGSNPFNGQSRFLQIDARTTIGAFTTFKPRQPLTPTPYAVRALSVSSGGLSDGTYANAVTFDNPANNFSGGGAGLTGLNASALTGGTVPDSRLGAGIARTGQVWQLGGNGGTTPGTDFIGTTDDQPFELKVNGLRAMRFEDNGDGSDTGTVPDGAPNVIGGSPVNFVAEGVVGATIAGGGATNTSGSGRTNSVLAHFGSVLGGLGNSASGGASTAMGELTRASGQNSTAMGRSTTASESFSTAMGLSTTASGAVSTAMGFFTTAGGFRATAMGDTTTASGVASTAMGSSTTASGYGSTAMGYRAKANHQGTFVWADWQNTDFVSARENEFAIRAENGVRIVNAGDGAVLLTLDTERAWVFRQFGTGANAHLELGTASVANPKNFLISATRVGIATTAPDYTLHVNGTAGKPGGGSWSTASDARLKDVGQPFTRGLEDLEKIQPTHYRYAEDNALQLPSDREYVGLIAQNVQASIPEAIDANDSGYLRVNNDPILWTMLNGIKELNAGSRESGDRIQKLEAENAAMKHELAELKTIVSRLAKH